jgi:hypothetical protein
LTSAVDGVNDHGCERDDEAEEQSGSGRAMQRTRAERRLAGLGRRHDPRIQRGRAD